MDDLCELVKFSIENKKVEGILNAVAPDIITNREFSKVSMQYSLITVTN